MDAAATLASILTPSDRLTVTPDGALAIGGIDCRDLVARFGSPLYVAVEATILENYHRIQAAFSARWPQPAEMLFSFKSNNNLAIRALLSAAGAGGDCFGEAELRATLDSGADPTRVALNGSDKSPELIDLAVAAGVTINIDGEDELGFITRSAARLGRKARVNLRLKVLPESLNSHFGGSASKYGSAVESVRRAKWGFTLPAARPILAALLASDAVELRGYSCHIGHLSNHPEAFAGVAGAFGEAVATLAAETGFEPALLDLGGGWARDREPEQRVPTPVIHPVEAQVEGALSALERALAPLRTRPKLWAEPGRFIVGNGQTLLATVGAIKRDAGYAWLHLDVSTNNLPRIETGAFWHHMLPATRMGEAPVESYEVVGGTCFRSVLGMDRMMPALARGDLVAILDAGMYAEVFANQFNCLPRPAGVMIFQDGTVELIRRAETIADVFSHHLVPARMTPQPRERP
jgi:diaminopimelate decarboxylase